MQTMTTAQIARLNEELISRLAANEYADAGCTLCDVARDNNLKVVRMDNEIGILYRDAAGRYVYGWTGGCEIAFNDQID